MKLDYTKKKSEIKSRLFYFFSFPRSHIVSFDWPDIGNGAGESTIVFSVQNPFKVHEKTRCVCRTVRTVSQT